MGYLPVIIAIQQSSGDLDRAIDLAAANPWAAAQAVGVMLLISAVTLSATWYGLNWWLDR